MTVQEMKKQFPELGDEPVTDIPFTKSLYSVAVAGGPVMQYDAGTKRYEPIKDGPYYLSPQVPAIIAGLTRLGEKRENRPHIR